MERVNSNQFGLDNLNPDADPDSESEDPYLNELYLDSPASQHVNHGDPYDLLGCPLANTRDSLFSRSPTPSDWAPSQYAGSEPAASDDSDAARSDQDNMDLDEDPLFLSLDEVYDEDRAMPDRFKLNDEELPAAFYEDPIIRNIYLRAFVEATFNHATHESIKSFLDSHFKTLKSFEARGAPPIDGLDNMARTLRTVERRLGVDPDEYIIYYFLCNVCWDRHHPDELNNLPCSRCLKDNCTGRLYTVKHLENGPKRVPIKILASCPLIPQIQRIMLRPGKFEEFQHWRTAADQAGPIPPEVNEGMDAHPDRNQPMSDIYDGWAWRAVQAGLSRRAGGEWGIQDVDVAHINQRFVALPNGLMFMMNIDW